MKRTLALFLILAVLAAAVLPAAADESESPAAAIVFRLSPAELTLEIFDRSGSNLLLPDEDGVYHLPVGEYTYHAGCPGYASERGGLRVLTADAVTLDLALTAEEEDAPASVSAAGSSENQLAVFDFLRETMKVNIATACGILANIQCESGFDPTATWIDTNNLRSYGLCQWNGPRYEKLKAFSPDAYFTVDAQLAYLRQELESSEISAWSMMQGIENSRDGAYLAGFRWAQYFERCVRYFNGTDQYDTRGNLAAQRFWPVYMPLATDVPDLTARFSAGQLTGYGAQDMAAIACRQILMTGSQLGLPAGYSGDWSAVFVLNCARYTGQSDAVRAISTDPGELGVGLARDWNAAVVYDPFRLAGTAVGSVSDARRGDLVCCDSDQDGQIDRIAIVTWTSGGTVSSVGAVDSIVNQCSYAGSQIRLIIRPKYAQPAYVRQCSAYASSGTLTTACPLSLMSLPCSAEAAANAGVYSYTVASLPEGAELTACALLKNHLGQYWYQASWGNSEGYLFAGDAALTLSWGEVTVTDPTVVPASHACKKSLVLKGSIRSTLLPLSKAALYVYPGSADSGTAETGTELALSQKVYAIGGETLDNNTRMGSLYAGAHKLVISAELTNSSSADGISLHSETRRYILHESSFTVVHSFDAAGSCSSCGALRSCSHSWSAAAQTREPTLLTAGEAVSSCSLCRTLQISQVPRLALGVHVRLPAQLLILGQSALAGISAETIIIPGNVIRIDPAAFADCRELKNLIFEGDPVYLAKDILPAGSSVIIYCARGSHTAAWAEGLGLTVCYRG